jgi:excisionase family DNA binding protein
MTPPLTVRQVAERLGVSPSCVYTLCAAGRIRHERHGLGRGVIRIPEDALEEYRLRCVREAEEARRAEAGQASRGKKASTFTNLDSERLLEAWREQGVVD